MIASAALQLAGSRFLFVSAGRMSDVIEAAKVFARASSIADSSRQNILAAFHLAELMARSKGQKRPRGSAAEAAQRAMAQLEQRRETEGSEGG